MSISKQKPYLSKIRQKHPTIAHDASAYQAGANATFDSIYTNFIESVETVDLAIRTIANIMSLCEMKIYAEASDGTLAPATIKNINLTFPNETDSRVDFMRKLSVNIWSQGAGLIVTEEGKRGKGPKLLNFYSLDVARITAESDGKRLISNFVYKADDSAEISYDASKCIYINDSIDPSNLLYSLSRLKSLNDVILMQAGIVGQAKQMLSGGAKKSAIISASNPISSKNMDKIKTEFTAFMKSAGTSTLFLNTDIDLQLVGNEMTGSEILTLFSEVNQMILKHFNIPQFLLGTASKGANKTEELTNLLRIFFSSQLLPVLTNIELHFTRFFQEQLGLTNYVMRFDYSNLDILKMPEEVQVDLTLKKHKAGVISLNEARKMLDMLPVDSEAADKVYMPAYLLGQSPVSYNDYTKDLERLMNVTQNTGTTQNTTLPSGNSGGADNTNVVTGSQGGKQ
jgi:HK97 family phage portal protein